MFFKIVRWSAILFFLASSSSLYASGGFYPFLDVASLKYSVGYPDDNYTAQDASIGFSLGAGYQMNRSIGFEFAYNDFGSSDAVTGFSPRLEGEVEATSYSLVSNVGFSVSKSVYLYGIFGVDDGKVKGNIGGERVVSSDTDPLYGLGISIQVATDVAMRLRTSLHSDQNLWRFAAGLQF